MSNAYVNCCYHQQQQLQAAHKLQLSSRVCCLNSKAVRSACYSKPDVGSDTGQSICPREVNVVLYLHCSRFLAAPYVLDSQERLPWSAHPASQQDQCGRQHTSPQATHSLVHSSRCQQMCMSRAKHLGTHATCGSGSAVRRLLLDHAHCWDSLVPAHASLQQANQKQEAW